MSEMKYRDAGCVYCRHLTSGDCGKHGPLILGSVAFGPPGNASPAPFSMKPLIDPTVPLKAKIAELERHQGEDQVAIKRLSGLLARAVAALWDAPLNSEGKKWIEEVSLELSDGETVPAIQRAREGEGK